MNAHHQSVKTPIQCSGILNEALNVTKCERKAATHFAICHGKRIKFFINLHSGIKYIKNTVSAYNKKLTLLLYVLPFIPWELLKIARLGYFVNISLHPSVAEAVPTSNRWNVLVGTYDEAQKLVLQCYSHQDDRCTFVKIGNHGSDNQMKREIHFLQKNLQFQNFAIPTLLHATLADECSPFNIQVTEEIEGEPIPAILTDEIYQIAQEIAGESTIINGEAYSFSHGDFAPWNIRKNTSTYTVFDWELCKMRPIGYDLAYFVIMTEIALHKRNFNEAYDIAKKRIRALNPNIQLDKNRIYKEFAKTTKTLQF